MAEGNGLWREYEGGIEDWLLQSRRAREIAQRQTSAPTPPAAAPKAAPAPAPAPAPAASKRKLSFKEQRELTELPQTIATLEAEQKEIADVLADGSIYAKDAARATTLAQRTAEIDELLLGALERWDQLSA
ncbi:hypothetical protein [Xylophilus rhododendri]|uniref:hypothetical protein n=1 Tax=Xylophilus rhododendri TaxID=2697032 RepID=UPI00389A222E